MAFTGVAVPGLLYGPIRRLHSGADPLGGTEVPPTTLNVLRRRKGSGRRLPAEVEEPLAREYGADLSTVRVHTDGESNAAARSVQATAFTYGTDIYFDQGAYDPTSASGQHVLAHELAHVAQPAGGTSSAATTIGRADDPAEHQADAMAGSAVKSLRDHDRATPGSKSAEPSVEGSEPGGEMRRFASYPAGAGPIRRMPVRNSSDARADVRKAMVAKGYKDQWSRLADGIGSVTIRDDVEVENLARFLVQGNPIDVIIRVINDATPEDLAQLKSNMSSTSIFRQLAHFSAEQGNLVGPTDQQVGRAYATFLANGRNATHLGLAGNYNSTMFTTFKTAMQLGTGQYWDEAAGQFRDLRAAFKARSLAVQIPAVNFGTEIFTGSQVDMATGAVTAVPNWTLNPHLATGGELALFLPAVPAVQTLTSPFTAPMRTAISEVNLLPRTATYVATTAGLGGAETLNNLMVTVAGAPNPRELLTLLDEALNPAVGPNAVGFRNAMNHRVELAPAAPAIRTLRARNSQLHFGARAGGLRGHFLKHPLGRQDPAYQVTALAEATQWAHLLHLAPNGHITRANLPNLAAQTETEWRIFAEHAQTKAEYDAGGHAAVQAASTPTNPAETAALLAYLQDPANLADATHVAVQHEARYDTHVSQAFDNAPNRFLYVDGILKVNAHDGNLFMVAGLNAGGAFDLSTGFLPDGGPQTSYATPLANRITDL